MNYRDISKSKSNLTANETENDVHKAPNATLYFSHSEAVLPFLSLLGLNVDDFILTHDSYEQAQNRYVYGNCFLNNIFLKSYSSLLKLQYSLKLCTNSRS